MSRLPAFAALAAVTLLLVAPIALRPHAPRAQAERTLVVITPHGEPTRSEFARAFAAWALRERNLRVSFDWRTPGGTGDIVRVIDGAYRRAFADANPDLPAAALAAFNDPKADAADAPEANRAARAAFLASEIGIGHDLFWGGGEDPHRVQAQKGYLVDAGLLVAEPAWFREDVIPQQLSGETVYDAKGRYYGACLSTFGICWSPDRLALLPPGPEPSGWADLGDPRFLGTVTMTDPTRSGAIVTALERLIQQRMATAVAAGGEEAAALARGWDDAFLLVKRIAGNSRGLTDGAAKPVRDVARGDAALAMCIDFNARAEAEHSAKESGGAERLRFLAPLGGTSVSADPIALLRGAPQRQLAVDFIRFVLSPEGQRLWNFRPGTEGGPVRYALRRLPVRRDSYTAAERASMSDGGEDPFAVAAAFTYRPKWTQPVRQLIGPLTKAVVLDPRDELIEAWRAIIAAGGPERAPEAMAALAWMPFGYAEARDMLKRLGGPAHESLALTRSWTVAAQERYREARRLALAATPVAR